MTEKQKSGIDFGIGIGDPSKGGLVQCVERSGRFIIKLWASLADSVDPRKSPIGEMMTDNLTTLQGLTNILNCYLSGSGGPGPGGTWFAALYVGLIDNASFTAVNYVDTAQKITTGAPNYPTTNNWKEMVAYSGSVRQPMGALTETPGASSVVAATFGTPPTFVATGSGNLQGAFLVTSSVQGTNAAGVVLYSAAASAGAPLAYSSGQTITVSLAITEASA